jgi:hypothetical protein
VVDDDSTNDSDDDSEEDEEDDDDDDADTAGRLIRSQQKSQYEMVVLPHQRSGPPLPTGSLKQSEPFAGHRSGSKSWLPRIFDAFYKKNYPNNF